MKVGDLIRGKQEAQALISWTPNELGIITNIKLRGTSKDVTVSFQDGETILLEMSALKSLFEVISAAP